MRERDATAAVLFLDKPAGPTSRAVLDQVEATAGLGPLGHAGTLDPLASGLLVILAGAARRLQDTFLAGTKVYEATLRLGFVSETHDAEGPLAPSGRPVPLLDRETVAAVAARFVGTIDQIPPAHSAVHVCGKRAHELARGGRKLLLAPRRVRIDAIEILAFADGEVSLRVTCGPGTYIRSLARDLGDALGPGAYLSSLRRTRSGCARLDAAVPLQQVTAASFRPMDEVLALFRRIEVDDEAALLLARGVRIPCPPLPEGEGPIFAWWRGRPLCRLLLERSRIRSDLTVHDPRTEGRN